MRNFKYIALLVVIIVTTACTESDIVENNFNSKNKIQVVARVMPFADRNVSSRGIKVGEETNIASLWLAIFDGQECKNLISDKNTVFEIDKTNIQEGYDLYIFANVDLSDFETLLNDSNSDNNPTLDKFLSHPIPVNGIDIPEFEGVKCFPMIGMLESKDINLNETIIEIPLSALYSKIVMNIEVRPDQTIEGERPARFQLDGFKVYNVVESVDFVGGTVASSDDVTLVSEDVYEGTIEGNKLAQGANGVTFSFYLPERFLQPETKSENYNYPFPKDNGKYRSQDSIYMQRYKPELVKENNPPATFVRFFGEFVDHQGHNYDVSYDIYVGNDNYSNFDVERNTQYNNNITIKGILNSNDNNSNYISVDHRVNVERVNPIIINLRRETLLDSHFEVRPLRIRKNNDFIGPDLAKAKVKVEVIYEDDDPLKNWIGLERSFGDGKTKESSTTYLVYDELAADRKNAIGKRKYFTTDLTTETLKAKEGTIDPSDGCSTSGGQSVIIPVNDECIWIYVDECIQTGDDVRSATVRVSFSLDGVNFSADQSMDYVINQRMLFPVTYTNGTPETSDDRSYNIEYYEEYLHNYDNEDSYGQTENEGMPWGLDGVQLSKDHKSFTNNTNNASWNNYVNNNNNTLPTYDFYIAKHDGNFAVIAGATMVHRYAGQHFTSEIFENSNGGVKKLTMDQQPSGAVEYCYNKNKRNSDGSIAKVEWYLPSADELEDFIVPAYASFKEFQDNYYWTSQPAYIRNVYYYEDESNTFPFIVYDDNPEYARATKVVAKGNNVYEYALSGLNEKTNVIDLSTGKILDFTGSGEINFGYFYLMYRWKNGTADETFGQNGFGGVVNGVQYMGEEFGEKLGGSSTNTRYHIHLGHLYDMTQEGYHLRTKSNRVRCVRKEYSADNEQTVLAYKVSTTPATSLDTSGNTLYVMSNKNYPSTYLTTSGTNVAASSYTVSKDNLVIIQNNKIKSVANGLYFNRNGSNASLNYSATSFTISNSGSDFTISYSGWQTYYLKQTSNTAVQMNSGNNGNNKWQFYEVTIQ